MCQRCLSTPCSWNQAYRPRETGERCCSPHLVTGRRHRPCGADSSISSASRCLSKPCYWNQAYRHNFLASCIVNFMRTDYRCRSAIGIHFARSFTHLDLRHRQGHHAVTDGIIRQRQDTLLDVSPCNQPSPGSHVDWHSAAGWPREHVVWRRLAQLVTSCPSSTEATHKRTPMGAVLRHARDKYVHTDLPASVRPGGACSAVRVKTPTEYMFCTNKNSCFASVSCNLSIATSTRTSDIGPVALRTDGW